MVRVDVEKKIEKLLKEDISKSERDLYLKYCKDSLLESKKKIRKISSIDNKLEKTELKTNRNLKLIRSKIKLVKSQLDILEKKEKFLLNEISSLLKIKKQNKMEISSEKKKVKMLKGLLSKK